MRKEICAKELAERIELNFTHLAESEYYGMEKVFSPKEYDWQGDQEGRALLAFVSLYKATGRKIGRMDEMLKRLPERLNEKGYMGPVQEDVVVEQQLSGHSWLLRGLCEHYEQFGDEYSLQALKKVTENLFLPTRGIYGEYPVDRENADVGGVSGTELGRSGRWLLSTDVGCAFMSVDGLSHVYQITKDGRVKELLDEMIGVYLAIDKLALRVQTHCTLTAARGMMRMYAHTRDGRYLQGAKDIFDLYVNCGGTTYTYQNLNWWGRPDTWTEPCAIVDSLMLALQLYKATGDESCRKFAARVYHNGLSASQRPNGGAGTDTVVCAGSPWTYLKSDLYEAYFCCSMRLSEGLWFINDHKDLLWAECCGMPVKNENGVYMDGDIVYAEVTGGAQAYAEGFAEVDGHRLCPIVKYFRVPKEIMENSVQQIVFA